MDLGIKVWWGKLDLYSKSTGSRLASQHTIINHCWTIWICCLLLTKVSMLLTIIRPACHADIPSRTIWPKNLEPNSTPQFAHCFQVLSLLTLSHLLRCGEQFFVKQPGLQLPPQYHGALQLCDSKKGQLDFIQTCFCDFCGRFFRLWIFSCINPAWWPLQWQ